MTTIESAPQQGTRLILFAPAGKAVSQVQQDRPVAGLAVDEVSWKSRPGGADHRIRILLVDDHPVMRKGLASLLTDQPDMEIVGEAGDGRQAVESARRLRPDVILMDFSMPVMDGVEATRVICTEDSRVKVIGLSMYDERDRSAAMMEAGAVGYVTKSGQSEALLETIRKAK